MNLIKRTLLAVKDGLLEGSYESLFNFVNFVPRIDLGFSFIRRNVFVPFWIVHLFLLMYNYAVGSIVYQIKYARDVTDFITCYVDMSLFTIIANNSYWFLQKRPLLKSILEEISESNKLATVNKKFHQEHRSSIRKMKWVLLIYFGFNVTNVTCTYMPQRVNVFTSYPTVPCFGMEPLTSSPNREICLFFLFIQEWNNMAVVLSFQALMLLLIAFTALLYDLLASEIMTLNNFDQKTYYNNPRVKEILPILIRRHVIILSIIDKLKSLYSGSIGLNFASNAVCMALFFYASLSEWLLLLPALVYCSVVFFLYCFLCQKLTNAAESFEMSVYACGWENFDLKEKKAISFMLRMAQKSIVILAADIIPVNLSTFATTLQAMYKFVTVLKT